MRPPERVQPSGHARHAARSDPDRVVHELDAEGNLELEQRHGLALASQPRHRDEAVEVRDPAARGVEVNRVPAAEQARHHRLGDARGQAGGHDGVCGAASLLEDLGSGLGCRGVARGDGSHARSVVRLPILECMRRLWWFAIGGGVVLAGLLVVLGFAVLRRRRERQRRHEPALHARGGGTVCRKRERRRTRARQGLRSGRS